MTKLWDISQRIDPATPVWPGEPQPILTRLAAISPECPVNVSTLTLSLHTGTHADSPFHYSETGQPSADCALAPYIGRCTVVEVHTAKNTVEMGDFDVDRVRGCPRVIFKTYAHFPAEQWDKAFTAIGADVINFIGQNGGVLVGTDAPSLDPQDSKTLDAHHQALCHDLRILEGLVLDEVIAGDYELIALPLKISGADASPVRAVLRALT